MLNPDNNYPEWLSDFKLNQPYFNELKDVLEKNENKIYSNIIEPYWEDIIKHASIGENVINQFYTKVFEYYSDDNSEKKLLLTDKYEDRCLFFNAGNFIPKSKVFIPKQNKEEIPYNYNFSNFKSAILNIANQIVVNIDTALILQSNPFLVVEDNLNCLEFDDKNLEQSEIQALIDYSIHHSEPFFKTIHIIESEKQYLVLQAQNEFVQYFTTNESLIEYLGSNKNYHLLPNTFYTEHLKSLGLLVGEELYSEIISDDINFIDSLIECNYPNIIKQYLLQYFERLDINTNDNYNEETYVFKILKLAIENLKENEEIEKFRAKIFIDNEQVGNITASNVISILGVNLHLSQILPNYSSAEKIDILINQFNGLKINTLFGINEQKTSEEVYSELTENELLDNAHKFVFAILYSKEKDNLTLLKKFKIGLYDSSKGQKNLYDVLSNDLLFLERLTFIDSDSTLNNFVNRQNECDAILNSYSEYNLNKHIKINDKEIIKIKKSRRVVRNNRYVDEIYYEETEKKTEKIVIAKSPFIHGTKYYCGKLKSFNDIDIKNSFFENLITNWKKSKVQSIEIINYNIDDLVGEDLELKVFPDNYAYSKEKLINNIYKIQNYNNIAEINQHDLIEFFTAFGLNNEKSDIVKLRSEFNLVTTDLDILKIHHIPQQLVANTLLWIENNKIKIAYNESDSSYRLLSILKAIYRESNSETIPLPIIFNDNDELNIHIESHSEKVPFQFDNSAIENIKKYSIAKETVISKLQNSCNIVLSEINPNTEIETIPFKQLLNTDKLKHAIEFDQFSEFDDVNFYKKWKNRYDYSIFITKTEIPYEVYANEILLLDTWCSGNSKIENKRIYVYVEQKELTIENIIRVLKSITEIQNLIVDLEKLKDEVPKENPSDDNDLNKARERLFHYEPFTFEWQKALIEYEHETQKKYIYKQKIIFNHIEINEQVINLTNPNVDQLPFSLAFYVNENGESKLPVQLFYEKNIQVVNAEILVVDEFSMQIEVEPSFDLKTISNIKQVKITLPPNTFLFDKLNHAISILPNEGNIRGYYTQYYLSEKLKFIFGPPGTGKTLFTALKILHLLSQVDNIKIGVFTPTNKSADVVMEQIIDILENKIDLSEIVSNHFTNTDIQEIKTYKSLISSQDWTNILIRFGNTYNHDRLAKYVKTRKSDYSELQSFVLISTIHRTTFDEFNEMSLMDYDFDFTFLDESSMIPLPYATFIIKCYENSKTLFIAGDPFQIPPVGMTPTFPDLFENRDYKGWNNQSIYTLLKLGTFTQQHTEIGNYEVIKLLTQFRSVPSIGNVVSKYLYNELVKPNRIETNEELSINNIDIKPITIIDYPVTQSETKENTTLELNDIFKFVNFGQESFYNPYSAILASELGLLLEKQYPEKTIGLISPYRTQVSILSKVINAYKSKISVGTVHGFQGDAKNIIILVLNPNNIHAGDLAFINNKKILNVGISRAKDFLIIIKPSNMPDLEINNIIGIANANYKIIHNNSNYESSVYNSTPIGNRTELFEFQNMYLYSSERPKQIIPEYELYISDNTLHIAIK